MKSTSTLCLSLTLAAVPLFATGAPAPQTARAYFVSPTGAAKDWPGLLADFLNADGAAAQAHEGTDLKMKKVWMSPQSNSQSTF